MTRRAASALFAIALAQATLATADTDCDTLSDLVKAAQTGTMPAPLPAEAEDCGQSLTLSGRTATHCSWAFSLKAAAATAFFDRMAGAISACFPNAAEPTPDVGVNHPDSFELRQYGFPGVILSLSLKDKAALGQSFVFLRAERTE